MSELKITLNVEECAKSLQEIEQQMQDAARSSLREAAEAAMASIRGTTQFQDRTGNLRRTTRLIEKNDRTVELRTGVPYARWVEFGTSAHVITPKTPNGSLRFFVKGQTVFANKVNHPGTKPRPFMEDAAIAGENALQGSVDRRVDEILGDPDR